MMKRRWMAVVGIGTAVAVAGLAAAAVGPAARGGREARMEKMIDRRVEAALDDIKATDAQRQKVGALKSAAVADLKAFTQTRTELRQETLALWNSEKPDAKAAHALVDQRLDAMRAMAHKMADRALELQATLTPEQRTQLAARFEQHHRGHGGRD